MNEFATRKECLERYCPVVRKNVLMDVTQSGTTVKVCCHHYDECKNCYGKCANAYASPTAEAAMQTVSYTQRHSW